MRNITVSVETADERRRRLFDEVLADFDARGVGLRMVDNLSRDALHDRTTRVGSCVIDTGASRTD